MRVLDLPTQTDHDDPPSDVAAARFIRRILSDESISTSASSMTSAVARHWRAASSSFAVSAVRAAAFSGGIRRAPPLVRWVSCLGLPPSPPANVQVLDVSVHIPDTVLSIGCRSEFLLWQSAAAERAPVGRTSGSQPRREKA